MPLMQDIDYGTPARVAETLVTLEIDGKPVTVTRGTSLMRAASTPAFRSRNFAPPKAWNLLDRAGSVWSKSKAAEARPLPAPPRPNPA